MSLTLLQRKKLHASIFGYLQTAEGGALFAEAAEAFRREAGLTEDDCTKLVSEGALETKWKTKRQLEVDLLKFKEWVKGQVPCLPPLLGDTEVDDGNHPSSTVDPHGDHHHHTQHHDVNGGGAGGRDSEGGASAGGGGVAIPVHATVAGGVDNGGASEVLRPDAGLVGAGEASIMGTGPVRLRRQCVEFTCNSFPRWGNCSRDLFGCDEHKLEGMIDLRRRKCEAAGCSKGAGFGFDSDTMRYCSLHKQAGMMNLRGKRCEAPGCRRHPLYGYEGERRQFCKRHRQEGMVYKVGNNCQAIDCQRPARFGAVGEDARFCMEHKLEGMMDVHHRWCEEPHCKICPSFAFEGERPRFCQAHKKDLMVNVSQRRCEYENCRRQPLWGWAAEQRARVCGAHKASGMDNIHVKRCEAPECRKQPNFGSPVDRIRRFCKDHKSLTCVNVSMRPCAYTGCAAGARCGYDDQAAVFCRAHRADGMRVVQRRVCLEPECDKLPSYGFEADRKRLYCAQHRLAGMTSLQRKCEADGCQTEPQFNYAGVRPPKFCQKHKAEGMMDVVSRKCQVTGCLKRPWYSYDGMRPVLCAEHKTPGMVGYRPAQKDAPNRVGAGAMDDGMVGVGTDVGITHSTMAGEVGTGVGRKRTFADLIVHGQHHNGDHHQHHLHHQHTSIPSGEHTNGFDEHGGNMHSDVGAGGDGSGADLVPDGLVDSVGSLEAMGMGEGEPTGVQEARVLTLGEMGGGVLDQSRMHVGVGVGEGVGVGAGVEVSGLATNIEQGTLEPTGMGSTDSHEHHHDHHQDLGQHDHHHDAHGHSGLEPRGLETTDLDGGGRHDGGVHHHPHHPDGALDLQPVLPAHAGHVGSLVGPSDKMFH